MCGVYTCVCVPAILILSVSLLYQPYIPLSEFFHLFHACTGVAQREVKSRHKLIHAHFFVLPLF